MYDVRKPGSLFQLRTLIIHHGALHVPLSIPSPLHTTYPQGHVSVPCRTLDNIDAMTSAGRAAFPTFQFIPLVYTSQLGWALPGGHILGALGRAAGPGKAVPFYGATRAAMSLSLPRSPRNIEPNLDPEDRTCISVLRKQFRRGGNTSAAPGNRHYSGSCKPKACIHHIRQAKG